MKVSRATVPKAFGFTACYDLSNYAIVKEFTSTLPRPEHLPNIHYGLDIFDKMGIMIEDSSPQNYRGGRLIDLRNTVTWPHCFWSSCRRARTLIGNYERINRWRWNGSQYLDIDT
ncbi:hypothetical protein ABVK25_008260 [Lepraria finkii]|uniref:Uncharacterized protein n=1 Tax=Lepraria finkii TaxID=1340010 RepID=A0ABR4B1X7_9LECA